MPLPSKVPSDGSQASTMGRTIAKILLRATSDWPLAMGGADPTCAFSTHPGPYASAVHRSFSTAARGQIRGYSRRRGKGSESIGRRWMFSD